VARLHVDVNGEDNPSGQGESWEEAYKYLQDAIDKASDLLEENPPPDAVHIVSAPRTGAAGTLPARDDRRRRP
jgi:hypothetical protein